MLLLLLLLLQMNCCRWDAVCNAAMQEQQQQLLLLLLFAAVAALGLRIPEVYGHLNLWDRPLLLRLLLQLLLLQQSGIDGPPFALCLLAAECLRTALNEPKISPCPYTCLLLLLLL